MRIRPAFLVAIFSVAALALVLLPAPASASCAATVRFQATTYESVRLVATSPPGGVLTGGVIPGCNDVAGSGIPPEPDTPIALRRISRVPAAVAVTVAGERLTAYLAPGFFVVRGHPLFRFVRRDRATPRACGSRAVARGRVAFQPGIGRRFVVGGTDVVVRPDARLSGHRRAGLPYVFEGARVTAVGRRCTLRGRRVLIAVHLTIGERARPSHRHTRNRTPRPLFSAQLSLASRNAS